ncbi:DEAD/DEAH box helicase [Dietzia cinnamea]|uniref:DEAD/DEAH box helicase n=1 Tax=Dietzia cinnamea TaxID=321318 RepID=UPI0021A48B38|nr:DEAD/DEAH box helicase [Dietzia cinnamea]MCT2138610.1 DEAD/DEAH box helicase [Dietzia cinnamea]
MSRSFADLGVPSPLLDVLNGAGITTPTPIQSATLPDALSGRDVLGRGRTGSGKTYAFCLPLVARLAASGGRRTRNAPRGLILAPTRELARQIDETLAPLANALGMKTTVIFGGVSQGRQVDALNRGVDIVVACPGRLEDLMGQKHCRLDAVEISVLDEADHMADLGFLPGVTRILSATPADAQRLLFSATLDSGVQKLVTRFLTDPVDHSVDDGSATPGPTAHHVFHVDADDRVRALADLAGAHPRTVMFTRTKHGAKRLAKQLTGRGVASVDLHGNLSQNARVRNLDAFSSGEATVLVATDIAARGIHVDDVGLVVHADPPAEHKAYVHRSGRTARAGAIGTVVTVATADQVREVRSLLRAAGVTAGEIELPVGADAAAALADAPEPPAHVPSDDGAEGQSVRGQSRRGRGRDRQSQNRQRAGQQADGQGQQGRGRQAEGEHGRGRGGQSRGDGRRSADQDRQVRAGRDRDGSECGARDQQGSGGGGARRRRPESGGAPSAAPQGSARQGSARQGSGAQRSGGHGSGAQRSGAQGSGARSTGARQSIGQAAGSPRGDQRRRATRSAG